VLVDDTHVGVPLPLQLAPLPQLGTVALHVGMGVQVPAPLLQVAPRVQVGVPLFGWQVDRPMQVFVSVHVGLSLRQVVPALQV
jgi:hypothetical protein